MSRNRPTEAVRECKYADSVASSRTLDALADELHTANSTSNGVTPVLPIADDGKLRRRVRLEQKKLHKPERFRDAAGNHK